MPHISSQKIKDLNQGLVAAFNKGLESVAPIQNELALTVPSSHEIENYSWIAQLPVVREFLTTRQFQNTDMKSMPLQNKNYESTIEIPYTALRDDKVSQYSTIMSLTGETIASHPRELIFQALRAGLATNGIDGVPFFSAAHPTFDNAGAPVTFSNLSAGAAEGWILLDNSRSFLRPVVYQLRESARVDMVGGAFDDRQNFIGMSIPFGTWVSHAAGLVLPHLAHVSFNALTKAAVYDAVEAMSSIRKADGMFANINPTHILVSPANRQAAEELFAASLSGGGDSNTLFNRLKVVVAPELGGFVQ